MSRFAIIFPWKEPKSWNKAMADISNKYNTGYLSKNKFSVADMSEVYLCELWRFPLYIQALASLFAQKRLNAWFRWICY